MKILWINNDGGGFANYIEVPARITVTELFHQQLPGSTPEDYLVRVNRLPVAADHVLQEGDRVSATPTKIQGAS